MRAIVNTHLKSFQNIFKMSIKVFNCKVPFLFLLHHSQVYCSLSQKKEHFWLWQPSQGRGAISAKGWEQKSTESPETGRGTSAWRGVVGLGKGTGFLQFSTWKLGVIFSDFCCSQCISTGRSIYKGDSPRHKGRLSTKLSLAFNEKQILSHSLGHSELPLFPHLLDWF